MTDSMNTKKPSGISPGRGSHQQGVYDHDDHYILAGAAAMPALSLPAFSAPTKVPVADPILAVVERHGKLEAEWERLTDLIVAVEDGEPIGEKRPTALVIWRNYHIGGSEMRRVRDEFLEKKVAKRATIEREFWKRKRSIATAGKLGMNGTSTTILLVCGNRQKFVRDKSPWRKRHSARSSQPQSRAQPPSWRLFTTIYRSGLMTTSH
jgi:hypothetical protein